MRLTRILAILAMMAFPQVAAAQNAAPRWEFAGGYNFFRANIVPDCDCFNAHGANASLAWNANRWFGIAGEFGFARSGNVQASGRDLTVLTYQAGPRVSIRRERATAFLHALVGAGRTSGSLYDVPLPGRTGTGPDHSWALTLGGGLDLHAGPRVAIRLVQADWVHTRFHNGADNKQHNLRITAGIVFRFAER